MTFAEARDVIVAALEAHIGCPVVLSDQISDMPGYPYCYYSVLTPRASGHAFGLKEVAVAEAEGGYLLRRSEPVSATMSFTFCSQNRETDGGYIFGEDEALALAEKANGFFLLDGHNIQTAQGDIVVSNVGSPANRSGFLVEDTVRRYGFDIRIAFVRTDEKKTTTVLVPGNFAGDAHS